MSKRLDVHDIKQFDEDGIRKKHEGKYSFKEGIIRQGTESEDFYLDRAKKLYIQEGADRIILLSRKFHKKNLEDLAEKIMEKCRNEWRRAPDDWLIREAEYTFTDNIEIIEKKKEPIDVEIIQINLVSNLYYTAEYYLADIHRNPNELSTNLCRILAGLYPKEREEKFPGGIAYYDPKDVLEILTLLTLDKALISYFKFFREFFTKKIWNIEEIVEELGTLLKAPTSFHVGLNDLHFVLRIIHKSLSLDSLSEVSELKNDIDNYFLTISNPEPYTDMLFRKYLQLFNFLKEFQGQNDMQDKLYFLEESRKIIRESEILVEDNFVEPFKKFYSDILRKWMDCAFKEGGKLLGRASLEARLQTKRAVRKEKLTVILNIRNIGMGAAEKIEVVLHNSSQYKVYGENTQLIDILQRNRNEDIEFQIEPQVTDKVNLHFSISYGDDNKTEISDTLVFVEQEEFIEIPNPYNFTRPAEGDMFFGREDLFQWMEKNMKGSTIYQNVLITGQRKTGKTSFLKSFQKRFDLDHCCVFIDLESHPVPKDEEFLLEVCQELHYLISINISPPNPQEFARKSYMAFGNYLRNLLSHIPNSKGIILIFDEFDKVEDKIKESKFEPGFLLFLRAFFQHTPRVTAIVGGKFDFEKLNSPEWKEFFTIFNPKKIGALDEKSARDIITDPVRDFLQYDEYAIRKILDFSGRNPYYIQLLCHTLINYMKDVKRNFVEVEDVSLAVLKEAKEKADLVLRMTWEDLDQMDKNILFALSRLRLQSMGSVGLEELEQYLGQNNVKLKKWRLFNLLEPLVEKDILTKFEGTPPYYDFNVALLGEWIADHGSYG